MTVRVNALVFFVAALATVLSIGMAGLALGGALLRDPCPALPPQAESSPTGRSVEGSLVGSRRTVVPLGWRCEWDMGGAGTDVTRQVMRSVNYAFYGGILLAVGAGCLAAGSVRRIDRATGEP